MIETQGLNHQSHYEPFFIINLLLSACEHQDPHSAVFSLLIYIVPGMQSCITNILIKTQTQGYFMKQYRSYVSRIDLIVVDANLSYGNRVKGGGQKSLFSSLAYQLT